MKRLILALAALTLSSPALAAIPNPPPLDPTQSVVDAANILTPAQEDAVNAQARTIYDRTHHHIVVLTMPNLDGVPGADYANNAFRFYKIGNKTRNDGVLLLVSMSNPRRLQIAVGYGLEGVLTDLRSTQITDAMKPIMKSGDYAGAIINGMNDIGNVIAEEVVTPQKLAETKQGARTAVQKADDSDAFLTFLAIVGILAAGGLLFYLFIVRPKQKRAAALKAKLDEHHRLARRALLSNNLDIAEANYKAMQVLDQDNFEASEGLRAVADARREAERAAERAREAAAAQRNRPITEKIGDLIRPSKPAASVGRSSTSSRNYAPTPVTPIKRTPAQSTGPSAASIAAAAEAERRAERQRRERREEEDRQRRNREDEERRQRDSWSSSSSSSSSSWDWGSSSSSSSSSYDSGSSSSFDSGGSSGGGGGGSDW